MEPIAPVPQVRRLTHPPISSFPDFWLIRRHLHEFSGVDRTKAFSWMGPHHIDFRISGAFDIRGSGNEIRKILTCGVRENNLMPPRKKVLFVCTNNSARSQIAEGLLRHLHGDRYEVCSAGALPTEVNPFAVEVLAERGIDISGHRPKSLDEFKGNKFDFVITVCDRARETCPFFPGEGVKIHKSFEDPAAVEGSNNVKREAFRKVRDQIERWIEENFGE